MTGVRGQKTEDGGRKATAMPCAAVLCSLFSVLCPLSSG